MELNGLEFKRRVEDMLRRIDFRLSADFTAENGKFTARVSDGTKIIGTRGTKPDENNQYKVLFRWGSGHTAPAMI